MLYKYKTTLLLLFLLLVLSLQIVDAKSQSSRSLEGKIITVDSGHGGRDSGTMYGKIYEKDLNLEISKVLKGVLEEAGATVYMIREEDRDLSSEWDKQKKRGDLYRRILFIQEKKSDLYLSIHINWGSGRGQEVLYHTINKNNKVLAESIMEQFEKKLKASRPIKKTDLYLYSNTRVPGVLVECGFLSNSDDRYLLQKKDYQEKLSVAIRDGVVNYFAKLQENAAPTE